LPAASRRICSRLELHATAQHDQRGDCILSIGELEADDGVATSATKRWLLGNDDFQSRRDQHNVLRVSHSFVCAFAVILKNDPGLESR